METDPLFDKIKQMPVPFLKIKLVVAEKSQRFVHTKDVLL